MENLITMQKTRRFGAGTIQDQLVASKFRPSGFDYLRITLAITVVMVHVAGSCYGDHGAKQLLFSPAHAVIGLVVPAFFALSGFLVTGSLERSRTIINFLGLRALRIIPALAVEALLSAFILGPIVTVFTLQSYFASPELHAYMLNIVGFIHYTLPGVFLSNPTPKIINAQLWTVPYELKCYVVLGALALFKLHQKRFLFLTAVIAFQLFYLQHNLLHPYSTNNWVFGNVLISCFLSGVTFYLFRESIILSKWIALACILFAMGTLLTPLKSFALAFPVAYVTVWFGTLNLPKAWVLSTGDYSYGIYLFGLPIEQTVAWLGNWTHHWLVMTAIALPVTMLVAVASYHIVEKHALALRRFLPAIEDRVFLRPTVVKAAAD